MAEHQNIKIASESSSSSSVVVVADQALFTCRFCKQRASESNLITTCLCPAEQSKVHVDCIEHYIDETGVRLCPICKFPYSIRYVRRYSIREGILIYNQNDLKMIWIRLFALLLVGSTMLPLISFSLTELLRIARQDEPNYYYSLFQTTSMTFLFYTLLLCSIYVLVCTAIIMFFDPIISWWSWWNSVTKIKFGPISKFKF